MSAVEAEGKASLDVLGRPGAVWIPVFFWDPCDYSVVTPGQCESRVCFPHPPHALFREDRRIAFMGTKQEVHA